MFEEISLIEIQYNYNGSQMIVVAMPLGNLELSPDQQSPDGQDFLKDCEFRLDGTAFVSPFVPISSLARQHFLFIQSFSYWQAGRTHFTRRRNLDSFLFCYTYSGSGHLDYEGNSWQLRDGDAFLIDCRKSHTYYTEDESWEHCMLHFSGACAESLYHDFDQSGGAVFRPQNAVEIHRIMNNLLKTYTSIEPYREHRTNALLTELLVSLLTGRESYQKAQEKMPPQLRDVILYINNNYARPITLDGLASSFAISKFHLCRCFRKCTGCTIHEYIIQLRLEHACELLRTTSLPAYQIGLKVGISDENYFYRLFRKHVGVPPEKYRK